MDLEQRLDNYTAQHPGIYNKEVVGRVRELLRFECEYPHKYGKYGIFKSIDDFFLLRELHPEWKEATNRQMIRNEVEGGNLFYESYKSFVDALTDDSKKRKELMRRMFKPQEHKVEHPYNSKEKWKRAYEANPEWCGRQISELERGCAPGSRIFVRGFRRWLEEKCPRDREKRTEIIRQIFKNYHIKTN